jgi:hypothetical protein
MWVRKGRFEAAGIYSQNFPPLKAIFIPSLCTFLFFVLRIVLRSIRKVREQISGINTAPKKSRLLVVFGWPCKVLVDLGAPTSTTPESGALSCTERCIFPNEHSRKLAKTQAICVRVRSN